LTNEGIDVDLVNCVDIVVDVPTMGDKTFTYKVPQDCFLPYGAKVYVPFGRRNVDGYVVGRPATVPEIDLKDIIAVYDINFLPPKHLLDFGLLLRDYYLAAISSFWGYLWPPQVKKTALTKEQPPALGVREDNAFYVFEKPRNLDSANRECFVQGSDSFRWKTYVDAIDKTISSGSNVLVLVPEINKAHDFEQRLEPIYGKETIAVTHSDMTTASRKKQWLDVKDGKKRIVVGTRSAVFNPIRDLGLVIVDDEESLHYKAEEYPKYNGRTVARLRGKYENCSVILGSYVPSVVANVGLSEGGFCGFMEGFPMSDKVDSKIVSLLGSKKRVLISKELHLALADAFASEERGLLFLNRRGTASSLACTECGNVILCPRCSVPMAYHSKESELVCHTCGYRHAPPVQCPVCQGVDWKLIGYGIDRARSEFNKRFPRVPVFQVDQDSKASIDEAIRGFESQRPSCLLCTQMIFSVSEIPEMSVLGVLSADNMLNLPDYLAPEEVFRLLMKLLGILNGNERSTYTESTKRFIIQTLNPGHHAIKGVLDPEFFYAIETQNRKSLQYPPFGFIMRITVAGKSEEKVIEASELLAAEIDSKSDKITVLGPSPAPKVKVRGQYRWHIMVKSPVRNCATEAVKTSLPIVTSPQVKVYVDLEEPFGAF
jgi:primosomal protein N' (replication factor Y)